MKREHDNNMEKEAQERMSKYSWSLPLGGIILGLSACYMFPDAAIGLPVFLSLVFVCFLAFVASLFGLWYFRKNKAAQKNSSLGILASLGLPFLFVFMSMYLPIWSSEYEGKEAKEKISEMLMTNLPLHAKGFQYLENPMIEWHAHAYFEAPKQEVKDWLASDDFCFDDLYYSFPIITPPMNQPDWWQMKSNGNQIKGYCGERFTKNHISYYISIDTMGTGPAQVYLYALDS
ncbi:MAG: hypothetical protein AAGD28_05165 [Bacteroidota bacterium]